MSKLKVNHIEANNWVFEMDQDSDNKIFLLNDIIFAQDKKDQVDIFYELKYNTKKNFMSILKYYNGMESRTIYAGNATKEIFDIEMDKIKF